MRALLVVHDPIVHDFVERALIIRGWRTERAQTPDRVAAVARSFQPQLVIVQWNEIVPVTLARKALDDSKDDFPPYLLVLVPQGDQEIVCRCLEQGADDVSHSVELEVRLSVIEARIGHRAGTSSFQHASPAIAAQVGDRIPRALLEGLFQVAPEGVVILGPQDRIVRVNQEFTRLFGYGFAETAGRAIDDLIVPPELKGESVELHSSLLRGQCVLTETVRLHKDGHLIDVSVLATPIEADGLVGTVAIYRNITEKKAQEAALRDSEARYRALFDQSPVGVFLCDRELRDRKSVV